MCVLCLFTSFLSVLFVVHKKNLVLQHLINIYMTFASEQFLKREDIVESKFLILVKYSFNLVKLAAVSL